MSKKIPATGIILAGGKSSRMGRDKALLPFGDATVLEHLGKLFDSVFEQVLIIVNEKSKYGGVKLPEKFFREDLVKNKGPLGGLGAGFAYAAFPVCFVATCDMPLLDEPLIRNMIAAWKGQPWDALGVENESGGLEPFPGVYLRENRFLVRVLLDLGHLSMKRLFEVISVDRWPVPEKFREFMINMNTPKDYDRVLQCQGSREQVHSYGI